MRVRTLLVVGAVLCVGGAAAPPAAAQSTADTTSAIAWLPRFDYWLKAEHLATDDPALVWEANYGGEFDLIDYGRGRLTFAANYQVLLGEQIRIFDPNQGNFLLEVAASGRLPGVELAGLFHHTSRHLSDRAKIDPVDWNMAGVRVRMGGERGSIHYDIGADVLGVVQKSLVDYRWSVTSTGGVSASIHPRLALLARAGVHVLGVDGTASRGTQHGYRVEGGVSLEGSAAALELFLGVERRIDPHPLVFSTATWTTAGFRISSR